MANKRLYDVCYNVDIRENAELESLTKKMECLATVFSSGVPNRPGIWPEPFSYHTFEATETYPELVEFTIRYVSGVPRLELLRRVLDEILPDEKDILDYRIKVSR